MMCSALWKDAVLRTAKNVYSILEDAVMKQRDDVHCHTVKRFCFLDSEMMCVVALLKDTDVHDGTVERCCFDNSGVMCMFALWKDTVLRQWDDVGALLKDDVLRTARRCVSTAERCCTEQRDDVH